MHLELGSPQEVHASTAPPDLDEGPIVQLVAARRRDGLRMISQTYASIWKARNQGRVVELGVRIRHAKHRVRVTRAEALMAKTEFWKCSLVSYLAKWMNWPRVKFVSAVVMVLITTTASVVGVWKLLQATPVFADSPVACAVLAALVGAVPFGIKIAIYANQAPAWRLRVKQTLGIVVVILFIAFAVLLAFVSGGLAAPVLDATALVDAAGGAARNPLLGIHLQWVQLLLEVSVGLACLCFADDLYETFGSRWPIPDDVAWMYARRFQRAERAYHDESLRWGILKGEERRLAEDRKSFVAQAVAIYLQKADQAKRQKDGIRRQKEDGEPPSFLTRTLRQIRRLLRN